MDKFKAIFTADWHLGAHAHGKIDRSTGINSVCIDIMNNATRMLEYCKENEINYIIHLGDIFEIPNPASIYKILFAEWLLKCREAKIEVMLLKGNHDQGPHVFAFEDLEKLDLDIVNVISENNVQVFDSTKTAIVWFPHQIEVDKKELTWIGAFNKLKAQVGKQVKELAAMNYFIIFCSHLPLSGATVEASDHKLDCETNLKPAYLDAAPFDLCVLGDIHKAQKIGDKIYYAGSSERLDFGARKENKRFLVLRDQIVESVSLPVRNMLQIECDFKDLDTELENAKDKLSGATIKIILHCTIDESRNAIFFKELNNRLYEDFSVYHIYGINRKIKVEREECIINGVTKRKTILESSEAYINHMYGNSKTIDQLLEANRSLHKEVHSG